MMYGNDKSNHIFQFIGGKSSVAVVAKAFEWIRNSHVKIEDEAFKARYLHAETHNSYCKKTFPFTFFRLRSNII